MGGLWKRSRADIFSINPIYIGNTNVSDILLNYILILADFLLFYYRLVKRCYISCVLDSMKIGDGHNGSRKQPSG